MEDYSTVLLVIVPSPQDPVCGITFILSMMFSFVHPAFYFRENGQMRTMWRFLLVWKHFQKTSRNSTQRLVFEIFCINGR
ncbi:uncharacterized protein DC041_0004446 [Schistosoma bovis]|uniref:Uncharacterized protein n=1 Tax=Schistosoma bovis TaxID=6184 RepID=A0A430QGZ5_SCHBO|nr:uncharacterized protein DC041_0004446 [Schistosoma bovis]